MSNSTLLLKDETVIESISLQDLKDKLDNFLDEKFYEFEEEAGMCLDMCMEENDFHMTSYWLQGVYEDSMEFIKKHYKENYAPYLYNVIFNKYSLDKNFNLKKLKLKVKSNFVSGCFEAYLAYEALASLLLKKYQYSDIWNYAYGCEPMDMVDMYNKYHINNAISDADFPVMKLSDVSGAMFGDNFTVQSSSLYDVFAHYADKLKKENNKQQTFIEESEVKYIFTPNAFQYEGVVSRWKNFKQIIKSKNTRKSDLLDYYNMFGTSKLNCNEIAYIIKDKYLNQFSMPPYSFPLKENNLHVIPINEENILVSFYIEGIENQNNVWKQILNKEYPVPKTPEDTQMFVINMSEDIKITLAGKEKERNTDILAIEGMYPRKNLATHGLNLDTSKFTLPLVEQQALYIIKNSLLFSNNPVLSCSFGADSVTVGHLMERVSHKFKIVFCNSLNEYGETIAEKNKLLKDWKWGENERFIEVFPEKGVHYFGLAEQNGWNFEPKGSRKEKEDGDKGSNSERCCANLKHIPMQKAIAKHKFDMDFSGLRGIDEGRNRELAVKRDGTVYYSSSWQLIRVNPIAPFSRDLLWQYIKYYNVPYSEIYDKILYKENGEIDYVPRTGCWSCLLTAKKGYLRWLKFYYPKKYWFLMREKGLAKTLYCMAMNYKVKKVSNSNQLSFLDNSTQEKEEKGVRYLTQEEIDNLDVDRLEFLIQNRPCVFQDNIGK